MCCDWQYNCDINDINLSIFITRVQHDLLHGLQGGGGWGVPHRVREALRDGEWNPSEGSQEGAGEGDQEDPQAAVCPHWRLPGAGPAPGTRQAGQPAAPAQT